MRRLPTLILLLSLPLAAQPLSLDDRLLVRESQLQLAQANIQLAQANANVAKAEGSLVQLILTLKEKYACKGQCSLNQDLIFVPPPKAAAVPDNSKEQKKEKPK